MTIQKQKQFDKKYLRMANIWSENSYAIRRQVGCLIVKDGMIISDGYNGTPSGFENICEDVECKSQYRYGCVKTASNTEIPNTELCNGCEYASMTTKPYVLHAEANAITKLAKSSNSSDGATIYVTLSPCIECAKLIIQSGIKRVVYKDEYRITDGLELLRRAGVELVHIKNCDDKNDTENKKN